MKATDNTEIQEACAQGIKPAAPARVRLDQLLVQRGFAESGEQARRLLLAGQVRMNGQPPPKAGTKVPADVELSVRQTEKFVGRGGYKLEEALAKFCVNAAGRICLDIGASTGGFTDCLLQHGALRVHAWDVGHGQLHWRIRSDKRVVVREGFNVRHLVPNDMPEAIRLVVTDVSFISLALILPPVFANVGKGTEFIVLIKPQFELAREEVGKGGIVRDPALHDKAVSKIRDFVASSAHVEWLGVCPSPIQGADGNREFLAHLRTS
jgi:23S rRNA (cytidine1920-2'-O)/16S rRNA (cytidine1409-2'-O)-methyltransferase